MSVTEELERFIAHRTRTLDRIRSILVEELGVEREPEEIDPDVALFGTGLGLDSVDAIELLVSVETEFDVILPDEWAAFALRTPNTVTDAVLRLEAAHGTGA